MRAGALLRPLGCSDGGGRELMTLKPGAGARKQRCKRGRPVWRRSGKGARLPQMLMKTCSERGSGRGVGPPGYLLPRSHQRIQTMTTTTTTSGTVHQADGKYPNTIETIEMTMLQGQAAVPSCNLPAAAIWDGWLGWPEVARWAPSRGKAAASWAAPGRRPRAGLASRGFSQPG